MVLLGTASFKCKIKGACLSALIVFFAVVGASVHIVVDTDYVGQRDTDTIRQRELVKEIVQESESFQEHELETLTPQHFEHGISINPALPTKYIWDYFPLSYNCPLREKVGMLAYNGDNGKWVCGVRTLLQHSSCVVYSFGSNGETAFEDSILNRTKCEVHVFDPTLSDAQKVEMNSKPGLTFHDYGLGTMDGQVSVSDVRDVMAKSHISNFTVKTLPSIMGALHHTWVDVLKVDIEGGEWAVLDALLKSDARLPFTQLQVEYHYWADKNSTHPPTMLAVLKGLRRRGFKVFSVEPNIWFGNPGHNFMEYAYIQVDADGEMVTREAHRRSAGSVHLLHNHRADALHRHGGGVE